MPTQILMPALSPTMEEGKLAKWLVKEGQKVKPGDILAEIETDKATMEVESIDEGVVGKILIAAGTESVKVNTPIATLVAAGEESPVAAPRVSDGPLRKTPAPMAATAPASPSQKPVTAPPPQPVSPTAPVARLHSSPMTGSPVQDGAGARIIASPLAKRIARERNLDLRVIAGTGPHGRIVQRDVEAALQSGWAPRHAVGGTALATAPPAHMSVTAPAIAPMADDKVLALYETDSYELVPHDGMRKVIAQRLTQSKSTVPHFYLTIECRLDELLRARERINAASPKEGPRAYKLSVNDFVIKALALALQRVPAANASWTDRGMLRHRHSDVGVAVAIEGGLFTPIIKHAELKTLAEISNEMKDLADRARRRRLAPHEYQGGTTSISNLGMYGITSFDAVINPPHATILAVGAGIKKPVVSDDKIEVATVMSCTLSCDHRVVDGALGADLLNAFRTYIEDPVRMLV
jgi:pyruvate dehydrogenase E2 component (dihydrolipoamide acetyltransferase)